MYSLAEYAILFAPWWAKFWANPQLNLELGRHRAKKALYVIDIKRLIVSIGGSAWESNPPNELLTRYTGFEVRESHQCPIHFPIQQKIEIILISVDLENNYLLYYVFLSVR